MSARALDRTRGWNLSVGRGLLNGATCVVSKVGRDALEVHLLGPARKLQGLTSPRVTVPRACVRPDVNLDSGDHGPHAYQPTCHKLPQGRFGCRIHADTYLLTYFLKSKSRKSVTENAQTSNRGGEARVAPKY